MNKRLFYALDIHLNDKKKIDKARQPFLKNMRPVAVDNLHITLCFMGNISTDCTKALIAEADHLSHIVPKLKIAQSKITTNAIGLFKKPQVLFLDFKQFPEEFRNIANALSLAASNLGIHQEKRPYHPHLTIARKAKKVPKYNDFLLTIPIHSFSLYESISTNRGVKYTPLKTWNILSND